MKPQTCISCEIRKPVAGRLLCYGCQKKQESEFSRIDAQIAADESNIRFGFDLRYVRPRILQVAR